MRRGRYIQSIIFLAAIFVCLAITAAESASLRAIPSLTLGGRWDSNVFNAATFERSDFVLTAQPGLTLAIGAFGTTLNLQGGVTAEKHMKFDELDQTILAKSFNLYPTDPMQISPSLQLRPTAYYSDTNDSRGQFAATPVLSVPGDVQGTPVNLTTISQRTREKEYAGSLTIIYRPSEKIEMELRGSGLKHEYDEPVVNVRDFRVYTAGATVYYRFTPRLQVGPAFEYEKLEPVGGTFTNVFRESLAGRYLISEGQLLDLRGGASHSRQETNPPVTTTSPYGHISLDSNWGTLHTYISGEYGIANEGVLGIPTKRFIGQLRINKNFSPRTNGELSGAFQRNWLGDTVSSQAFSSITGSLTLRYLLSSWATIRLSANHFNQTSNSTVAGNLKRDTVFLGIDLSEPFTIY